jgi:glutaredoxin 3
MDVIIYTTESCSYCRLAKRLLDERGIEYDEIDCTHEPDLRRQLVERTGRRTVPQIFIDDVPIGGFDELAKLDREGELARIANGESSPTSVA